MPGLYSDYSDRFNPALPLLPRLPPACRRLQGESEMGPPPGVPKIVGILVIQANCKHFRSFLGPYIISCVYRVKVSERANEYMFVWFICSFCVLERARACALSPTSRHCATIPSLPPSFQPLTAPSPAPLPRLSLT